MNIGLFAMLYILLAAFLSMLCGFFRGTKRALIRLCSVLLAVLLSFFVAIPITHALCDLDLSFLGIEINGNTLGELSSLSSLLAGQNEMLDLALQSPAVSQAMGQLPYYTVAPFAFMISFLLCMLFTLLLHCIVNMVLRMRSPEKRKPALSSRLGGVGIGLLQGLLCTVMLSPLAYLCQDIQTTLPLIGVQNESTEQLSQATDIPILSFLCDTLHEPIGALYMQSASVYTVDQADYSLRDDLHALGSACGMLYSFDMQTVTKTQCQALSGVLMHSPLVRHVAPSLLRAQLEKSLGALGVPRNAMQVYDSMIAELSAIYCQADIDHWLLSQNKNELPLDVLARYEAENLKKQAVCASFAGVICLSSDSFTEVDLPCLVTLAEKTVDALKNTPNESATPTAVGRALQKAASTLAHETDAADAEKLRTLYQTDRFACAVITIDMLRIRDDAYVRISRADIQTESEHLGNILYDICVIGRGADAVSAAILSDLAHSMRESIILHNSAKPILRCLSQIEALADHAAALESAWNAFDGGNFDEIFGIIGAQLAS